MKIVRYKAKNFFEGVKAKKHSPPEEKIDPVKAKCTLAAQKKPPKSPAKGNYERIITKSFIEAERSGSTVSGQRLAERGAGEKLPSSANKRTNRSHHSRCLASSLMIRGWCPVITILEITCPTMYIMISWRWTNTNTSTGSLSSKMKDL